ncbi:MAG: BON domain-containing protein [Rubrivivax sp.]|nr:BON domain-containing protein [Rubrivivax sp.]
MNLSLGRLARCAAALAVAGVLSGCAPLVVGSVVVGGTMVATDRRTTGTQVEDQTIELKAADRAKALATLGHVNVVSYNRVALITGEVPSQADKERVGSAVAGVQNVRGIVNELGIGGNSTFGSQSTDAVIGGKVKASLVDAPDLQANAFKVVVERAVVFLMGRVTQREADRATEIARSVSGVQKVVQVFDILTEQELAALGPATAAPASAASAAQMPR